MRAQNSAGAWSDFSAATVNIEDGQQAPQEQDPPSEPETPKETDTPSPTATPEEMTIYNIEHDLDKFYYGGGTCGSREVTISADITHPDDAYAAFLFIHFFDNEGGEWTDPDSGRAMGRKSDNHFSVTLFSENIPNYNAYEFATMNYQIVVQDKADNNLARTEVIRNILLERCP